MSSKLAARYVLFLIGILAASSWFARARYNLPYPKPLGVLFGHSINKQLIKDLETKQPEIILIGDSVLREGVDNRLLSETLQRKTYSIGVQGSGSAVWYLILKNIVAETPVKPKTVVILFRDTLLTIPTFRTQGNYFPMLDEYASRKEPLVSELAFIHPMSPLEKFTEQYLPLYSARWDIRSDLDSALRYPIPQAALQCGANCVDQAMDSAFGAQNMDAVMLQQSIYDEGVLTNPANMNFEKNLEDSFLPYMIHIAREKDIRLLFIRMKTLSFPEEHSEPKELRNYIDSLRNYLDNHEQVQYIDLAHDERIKESFFEDMVHLNAQGRQSFTHILAKEIEAALR